MILVTGYPKLVARRMAEAFLEGDTGAKVALLTQAHHAEEAERWAGGRMRVLVGDVAAMHLGLSTPEYRELSAELTDIVHAAEWSLLGASRLDLERVNMDGTRAVLELGHDCKRLRRFTHFSTVFVCGDRQGVVAEDELSSGQSFRNAYEQTKFEAEILVRRAMADLPCTIVRPGIVLGDSRAAGADRFDAPYAVAILLVVSPVQVAVPLPGGGVAPLHLVPIDYVVAAAKALHGDPRAAGRTFHLVDPNPWSARRVSELVAKRAGTTVPRNSFGSRLADAVLKLPGLERLTREQRGAVAYVQQLAFFNCRQTLEILEGTGIRCPPVEASVEALVAFGREAVQRKTDG